MRLERHECHTSNTSVTGVRHKRHECDTNDTGAARVKNFDFDYDTSKNIFLHPYIYYAMYTRRGTISFEKLPFGNAFFPCQNAFEKCTTKTF